MEIIKLGINSLKISLSREEAEKFDFIKNKETIDYENSDSLRELLEKAKKEVGFDAKGRICVEIYTSSCGDCEIFVSKAKDKNYKERNVFQPKQRGNVSQSIFAFDNINDLLVACKRLAENSMAQVKSKIYYDTEKYYLFIFDEDTRDIKYYFLTEYSKYIKNTYALEIIERSKCLSENNGVEIFSKLL
ncbi:MAG: adaptor protein MecA [Clostridia bacterium]|nr:adaptor protein MecA [Clostridia bacterium]